MEKTPHEQPALDLNADIRAFQEAAIAALPPGCSAPPRNPSEAKNAWQQQLQQYVDMEVTILRMDTLVDELVAQHCADPASLVQRFSEKLKARTLQLRQPTAVLNSGGNGRLHG